MSKHGLDTIHLHSVKLWRPDSKLKLELETFMRRARIAITVHELRTSGILLHPTSLPGRFGIGDLGRDAYAFVDFLEETRQSLWQMLPLGPTGFGDSPYQCFSAFAGNPILISLEQLASEGLLNH